MAVEADVLDELRRLRSRLPQLTGSLAASVDGLVLAQDAPDTEPEGLAALTAAALGVAQRMADATARGAFRELLLRGAHGYVATYTAGPTAVLTLLADDRVNVGRLHLEGRRSGARIGELVAARIGPHEEAPRSAPAVDPGRPIGTLPVRTPRRSPSQTSTRARPRPDTGG
ncbi:roadblock/LC7 domain-containing protein [Streptomyces sp. NPDC057877]|uniref:roadblock/LC7 domain-containing protein n=1 Tax=Streptomyces sp. NPDC057877 TaxID=3346269 RepID=UPI00367C3B19